LNTLESGTCMSSSAPTVYAAFVQAARRVPGNAFLCQPSRGTTGRRDISYRESAEQIEKYLHLYRGLGCGHGHRVALLLGTTPEFVFHYLALNALGAAVIPINPDNRLHDNTYLFAHSEADLVVATAERLDDLRVAAQQAAPRAPQVVNHAELAAAKPVWRDSPRLGSPTVATICSLLYTSGTTGEPKGCLLSNHCHLTAGAWYRDMGGVLTMREGDRFYNPTPFHHVNNLVVALTCVIITGNCLILVERFTPARWWHEIVETQATVMHYVGIVPSLLMGLPPDDIERGHQLRFGFGAGIEPQLHQRFEERFRIPLVEIWGMTETPRVFGDNIEPRQIHTRAFGRPCKGYEAMVIGEDGEEAPRGHPGELLVRSTGPDPRLGFFSGYLKNEAATEEAWRNGWFHTGDIVVQSPDDMLYFVDRKKNIIRRAGENISAVEVESLLITHPAVHQVAVIAVPDELRDEEVMACVILVRDQKRSEEIAREIAEWFIERSVYYKCPAWMAFVDSLPVTPSQRLQRTKIFPAGLDPRTVPGAIDLRSMKKRPRQTEPPF
jgi:acyl-coenzyme A synthetase/AMP-(fatty) acid ligase